MTMQANPNTFKFSLSKTNTTKWNAMALLQTHLPQLVGTDGHSPENKESVHTHSGIRDHLECKSFQHVRQECPYICCGMK